KSLCARIQHTFQLARAYGWTAFHVEGGHAAHDWGGHRRSTQLDVLAPDQESRIVEREGAPRRQGGDDAAAWCDEVWLAEPVLGHAVGRKAGQRIVDRGHRA